MLMADSLRQHRKCQVPNACGSRAAGGHVPPNHLAEKSPLGSIVVGQTFPRGPSSGPLWVLTQGIGGWIGAGVFGSLSPHIALVFNRRYC